MPLDKEFDIWTSDCGWDPHSLRRPSESTIRSRDHEAIIEHEFHKACGNQPNIFTLYLGSLGVVYTEEPAGVMIRGYGRDIDREPLDDYDGGGVYAEASWATPT